jgi:hypothetical protein
MSTAFVSTLAGTTASGTLNGIGTNARFYEPHGAAIFPGGQYILLSTLSNSLRKVEVPSRIRRNFNS